MIINPGSSDFVRLEKLRDLDVVLVFFAAAIVLHQYQRLFGGASNAIKFAVGPAFLNRRNSYFIDIESRKMPGGLAEKELGSHESDVDVAMNTGGSFSGADNTTKQLGL